MKGWIKYFADGTSEKGTDRAVRLHEASWRNGRQGHIIRVEAWHDRFLIAINGVGCFWQSDDCEVPLYANHSRVVCRRIQKQIDSNDKFMTLVSNPFKLEACIGNSITNHVSATSDRVRHIPIEDSMVGKWVTLEIDVCNGEMRVCFTEECN